MKLPRLETLAVLASALCFWQPMATAQGLRDAYPGSEPYRELAARLGDHAYPATGHSGDPLPLPALAPRALAPMSSQRPAPDCTWPSNVMDRFHQSVERGELLLFGRKLTWDELTPLRIEYAYELTSRATTVAVHSELIAAVSVPEHDTMVVRRVAAVMTSDGGIVETRMYVSPR